MWHSVSDEAVSVARKWTDLQSELIDEHDVFYDVLSNYLEDGPVPILSAYPKACKQHFQEFIMLCETIESLSTFVTRCADIIQCMNTAYAIVNCRTDYRPIHLPSMALSLVPVFDKLDMSAVNASRLKTQHDLSDLYWTARSILTGCREDGSGGLDPFYGQHLDGQGFYQTVYGGHREWVPTYFVVSEANDPDYACDTLSNRFSDLLQSNFLHYFKPSLEYIRGRTISLCDIIAPAVYEPLNVDPRDQYVYVPFVDDRFDITNGIRHPVNTSIHENPRVRALLQDMGADDELVHENVRNMAICSDTSRCMFTGFVTKECVARMNSVMSKTRHVKDDVDHIQSFVPYEGLFCGDMACYIGPHWCYNPVLTEIDIVNKNFSLSTLHKYHEHAYGPNPRNLTNTVYE